MPAPKAAVENIYPLTPMQEGMLFHALLEPHSTAYFEQLCWRMRGQLDIEDFAASWNELIARHAILRSVFAHEGTDRPLQVVLKSRPITVQQVDLRGTDVEQGVAQYRAADRARRFVLNRDPLMRVAVLRLADDQFGIVWSHHHIVLDGWSVGLVLAELLEIYGARRAGTAPVLPAVTPFAGFVKWLRERDHDAAARFWTARLADCTARVTVPHTSGGEATSVTTARGRYSFGLGASETAALADMAARRGVTMAVLAQAMWALLLGRYSDLSEVVFGSVVSGRPPEIPGVDRIIGNFINTVPVRVRLDPADTFDELLVRMQRDAAQADPHQHVALSRVESLHRLEGGLFGTLVSFANYPVDSSLTGAAGEADPGFVVEDVTHVEETHYDLDVQFVPASQLQVRITYAKRFYPAWQIAAIEDHLRAIVTAVTTQKGMRLDEIDLLSAAEKSSMRGAPLPVSEELPDTLDAAFARQAAQTPNRIAVAASNGRLTYADLDRRVNQLARRLREAAAIEPDTRIGVLLGRGTEMAVGLLAVLRSGGAYVPLEPYLPRDRISYILEDAGCKAVIASAATVTAARAAASVPVVNLDDSDAAPAVPVNASVSPSDLAYVIYTSGSTGRPKGVMIEHRSVINLVNGLRAHAYDRYESPLRVSLLASFAFDASVQQIFAALLLGHTLVIVDEATKRDGEALNRCLLEQELDVIDGTPTLLRIMAAAAGFDAVRRRVRHALIGGEPLPWALMAKVLRQGGMVVSNVYGPTECCVDATAHLVSGVPAHAASTVPVGRPLSNVQAFVIGRTGHLAPRGAHGEICIAGAGVARGYLNDEALSANKFVTLSALGALRVFRTGDAGRILADGSIDCLGRLDAQVKVQGLRIELGEIEHQLLAHPDVTQAAAFVIRTDEGDELRATVVLSAPLNVDQLRAHLGQMLPEYMIPSRFIKAQDLPRTSSGKLDRKALAAGDLGAALEVAADYAMPTSNTERELAQVWQDALGVARVGIDDNYFSLGGDSIKAIQILSRMLRRGLRMEIRDLFQSPTIRALAPFVVEVQPETATTNGAQAEQQPVLTAAQARFFAEHKAEPGRFHHAVLLDAGQRLDPSAVGRAFAAVRDRHEGLRLRFQPEPHVTAKGGPSPEVPIVTDLAAAQSGLLAPFDLAAGALHRIAIVRSDARDQLLVVVHHLCIDGVSWRILIEDLNTALLAVSTGNVPQLPAVTDGPIEVARRLLEYGRSQAARGQLGYWQDVEARAAAVIGPADAPRALHRDRATLSMALDEAQTSALLMDANRAYSTSPEELLLTALARAVYACFGSATTGILLESHGRHPVVPGMDASRTIGWFTSLYPFVLSLAPARDLGFQVKTMKEAVRAVPDSGVAYGLLRYLGDVPLASRPQISFNYLGRVDAPASAAPLRMSPEFVDGGVSPEAECLAELELSALAVAGRLRLMVAFNARRFEQPAMQELLETWYREQLAVVDYCQQAHTELTPADLSYSALTVDQLQDLFE